MCFVQVCLVLLFGCLAGFWFAFDVLFGNLDSLADLCCLLGFGGIVGIWFWRYVWPVILRFV